MMDVDREQALGGWTPWGSGPGDWRWWATVGVVAALGIVPAFVGAWLVATVLDSVVLSEWLALVAVGVPYALVGLLTGAIGGVKGWRLIVPTVLPYSVFAVSGDTRFLGFVVLWVVLVLGTWLGRALAVPRSS